MKLNSLFAAGLIAFGLTACGKPEPPPPPPAAAPAPTQPEGMDHSQMLNDCDMQGRMSAAEHQAMMEKCQPPGTNGDSHAERSHGDQP